jgi:hypothetical protein
MVWRMVYRVACATPQYHGTRESGGITVQIEGEYREGEVPGRGNYMGSGKFNPGAVFESISISRYIARFYSCRFTVGSYS